MTKTLETSNANEASQSQTDIERILEKGDKREATKQYVIALATDKLTEVKLDCESLNHTLQGRDFKAVIFDTHQPIPCINDDFFQSRDFKRLTEVKVFTAVSIENGVISLECWKNGKKYFLAHLNEKDGYDDRLTDLMEKVNVMVQEVFVDKKNGISNDIIIANPINKTNGVTIYLTAENGTVYLNVSMNESIYNFGTFTTELELRSFEHAIWEAWNIVFEPIE